MGIPHFFHRLNETVLTHGFHPFYLYAAGIWLVLLGVRAWHWRRRRYVRCEVCGHEGYARNEVQGSWKAELIRFFLFVPPGFFLHILMGIYLTYFVYRWFLIRRCARCDSECLAPASAPLSRRATEASQRKPRSF